MAQRGAHDCMTLAACELWYSGVVLCTILNPSKGQAEPVTLLVISDGMILLLCLALAFPKLQSNLVWCKQLAPIVFTIGVLEKENLLMMHVVYPLESNGGPFPKDSGLFSSFSLTGAWRRCPTQKG